MVLNHTNRNLCRRNLFLNNSANILKSLFYFLLFHANEANANCYNLKENSYSELSVPTPVENRELFDCFIFSCSNEPLTTVKSIDYLNDTLISDIERTDQQLGQLSELLGNWQAALSLAAGTLNANEANLKIENYISTIKQNDDKLINSNLTEHEKKIWTALSTGIYVLVKNEGDIGKLAVQILLIFGYTEPSHYVQMEFLEQVENKNRSEIELATNLLKNYSIIEKEDYHLIINKFLQPVIRYYGQKEKNNVLKKMLSVEGYLDYKLFPSSFADETLQEEFPEIKTQLIEQPRLIQLVADKKYNESLELSENIHNVMKSPASLYNYGVCAQYAGMYPEAVKIFTCLNTQVRNFLANDKSSTSSTKYFNKQGIADLNYEPERKFIEGNLLLLFLREKNIVNGIKKLVGKKFLMNYSHQSLHEVLELLNYASFEKYYSLKWELHDPFILLDIENDKNLNQIYLHLAPLNKSVIFPPNVQDLELQRPWFLQDNGNESEKYDMNHLISPNLTKLALSSYHRDNKLSISLDKLTTVPKINLGSDIQIVLNDSVKLHPEELELNSVFFVFNSQPIEKVFLNEYFDFNRTRKLKLVNYEYKKNMKLDMSKVINVDDVHFANVEIADWQNSAWKVKTLYLRDIEYVAKTKMTIIELETKWATVDLAVLPQTIEKWILNKATKFNNNGPIYLENLKYLNIPDYDNSPSSIVPMFANCSSLVTLDLDSGTEIQLNADDIPKSVKTIKAHGIEILGESILKVDKVILSWNWSKSVTWKSKLNRVKPKHLVFLVNYGIQLDEDMEAVMNLIESNSKVTVGKFIWGKFDFQNSEFAKLVDRKAEYYTFGSKKGVAIEKSEFQLLFNVK